MDGVHLFILNAMRATFSCSLLNSLKFAAPDTVHNAYQNLGRITEIQIFQIV